MREKSQSVTIHIKATKQYFTVVLFITLYEVVRSNFEVWIKSQRVFIQANTMESVYEGNSKLTIQLKQPLSNILLLWFSFFLFLGI